MTKLIQKIEPGTGKECEGKILLDELSDEVKQKPKYILNIEFNGQTTFTLPEPDKFASTVDQNNALLIVNGYELHNGFGFDDTTGNWKLVWTDSTSLKTSDELILVRM